MRFTNLELGNYVNMLGYGDNKSMTEYLRLYIALHGDHEGGNVSAHTAREPLFSCRLLDRISQYVYNRPCRLGPE